MQSALQLHSVPARASGSIAWRWNAGRVSGLRQAWFFRAGHHGFSATAKKGAWFFWTNNPLIWGLGWFTNLLCLGRNMMNHMAYAAYGLFLAIGWLAAPEGLSSFSGVLGYCARNNSVIVRRGGWGAANNHSCDATLEMGCGGVGLITSKNVPWHLQTHVLLR